MRVTFGFVIDPETKSHFPNDKYGTWFNFLRDDYAATLTDCINSVFLLDRECNLAGFLSITENNAVDAYNLPWNLPYRFANIIEKYVFGTRVGVFLLNNGDIILSKNKAIRLIKRNLKWLNLSYEAFANAAYAKINMEKIPEKIFKEVYASTLDVSFSHTGGIISVVYSKNAERIFKSNDNSDSIINICDNLKDRLLLGEIEKEMTNSKKGKGVSKQEIFKRLLKRRVILALIEEKTFDQIDRKLRTELISMDGACILDENRNVCAFGAIIQNESGSSGGGRSAAARKLSQFGMAVKISTDGYIELFIDGEAVYAIK